MLQNPLSYDTPNCGNAIPKIVKRQVSNSSEGGSLSAITLFQAAARILPGFGKCSKNNQEGKAQSSGSKRTRCLLFQPKLNFTFQILLHGKEIR